MGNKKIINKNNIQSIYFHPTSNIQPPWCFFLTPTNPTGPGWVSLTKGPKDTCRAASGAYAFRVLTWCLFRKIHHGTLRITQGWKKNHLNQTTIFGVQDVNFPGFNTYNLLDTLKKERNRMKVIWGKHTRLYKNFLSLILRQYMQRTPLHTWKTCF